MKKLLLALCFSGSCAFGSQIVNPSVATSGSGGYALQPATVTIQANFGITATTMTVTSSSTFQNIMFSSTALYGIVGSSVADTAAAGNVGEYISSVVGYTNFPTSGNYGDLSSIILTAGDWDVTALATAEFIASANTSSWRLGVSTTSGNAATGLVDGDSQMYEQGPTATFSTSLTISSYRVSIAGSTTVYMKYFAGYTSGPPKAAGRISARRVR